MSHRAVLCAVTRACGALLLLAAALASPAARAQDGWTFAVTPYLWMSSLSGDVRVSANQPTASVDVSFSDLFENLEFAIMGVTEARNGPWGIIADIAYTDLSADGGTPGPAFDRAEVNLKSLIMTTVVAYRVYETDRHDLDLLGGARWWWSDTSINLRAGALPGVSGSQEEYWVDPVIGARLHVDLGGNFSLATYADIGGFGVSSDLTWQVYGGLTYAFNDAISAGAGWRHLSVDYENDGYIYDVDYSGPILGVSFRF